MALISLLVAALVAAILATTAQGVSHARPAQPDSIALVDASGHFRVLTEVSADARTIAYTFGMPGDVPLMGDWDCNGEDTPGLYRPSVGRIYLRNSQSGGVAQVSYLFGNPGDEAVAGDFDGDGCDTVSVYRSRDAAAYVKNGLAGGTADTSFLFGVPGDRAFVGDFDGNGKDTFGLRRDSTGRVYLARRNAVGTAAAATFGNPGDQIVAGDWDGDGIDTVAAYRSSNGMFYYRNSNTSGTSDGALYVGSGLTVVPVSGVILDSTAGEPFEPDKATPTPQPEVVPAPSAPTPVSTGGVVSVAGFAPPPPRAVSGPVVVSGDSNVVIENLHISNPGGQCVVVRNASNVTIRNSTIGPCGDEAVYLSDVDGAVVSGNYISGTGNGVLVHRSDSVRVDSNAFVNAGRNFVQFDKVNGAGSSISGNRGQNEVGGSNAEDFISLWQSNGTGDSPIVIAGNHLRNGGPSNSGSGIMLGDGGGSNQLARGNVLVDPGQVGIGVAGGHDIRVLDNSIYSSALPWSNVGLYTWDFGDGCGQVEVSGNRVNWTAAGGYSNGFWNGGGCSLSEFGNDWNANIGPAIWD